LLNNNGIPVPPEELPVSSSRVMRGLPACDAGAFFELELELILSHMTQKPMLRGEVGGLGVGPYFAKFFAKFHLSFKERNFREILPLLEGFGEISANFSKFAKWGRNFVKFSQKFAKFRPTVPMADLGRKRIGRISPNPSKRGEYQT
jgi:hypothetical protein